MSRRAFVFVGTTAVRRHPRTWVLVFAFGCVCVVGLGAGSLRAAQPQGKEGDYAVELQKGNAALQAGNIRAAIESFKKANGLHGQPSVDALFGLSRAYFAVKEFQNAADSCSEALKYTGADKRLEAQMHYMRGLAEMGLAAQKSTGSELKTAESDFRATVELTDAIAIANYNLGVVLLKQGRDADGVRALQAYVDRNLPTPEREEAIKLIADPKRARLTIAPNFTVPTLQGQRISLSDYRGKVVLLDFWGTWCGPCREFTPTLVEVNTRYANEPFVTIGVAVGEKSESEWKQYISDKKMVWPQYLDNRQQVAHLFDVHEFPTYILIDHEGAIRDLKIGYGPDNANWLTYSLKQFITAAKAAEKRAPTFFSAPGER